MIQLKKHLKESHKRYLCELCVENSVILLSEQKLFTKNQLNLHNREGDYDENDNLILKHPYCVVRRVLSSSTAKKIFTTMINLPGIWKKLMKSVIFVERNKRTVGMINIKICKFILKRAITHAETQIVLVKDLSLFGPEQSMKCIWYFFSD